jgi:Rad3-related DNA helicase
MSATVGNVDDLAAELGIEKYGFERVPNQWPAKSRPVHVADVPAMGQSASDRAKMMQAEKIAKVLKELPRDWSGIIHVTSWKQAYELKDRLNFSGVDIGRLFIPTRGQGTNKQMQEWNGVKRPGMLVITPSMDQGVDLLQERICIIAKTPFPFCAPGSYEFEKMVFDNRFYRWQTAASLEQRAGRTRRGREGDYDTEWDTNGYVGIFDGAFRKMGMAKHCSVDFTESLVFE